MFWSLKCNVKTRWDSFVFWVVHKVKFILSDWQLLVPGSQQYLTELFKAGWRVIRVPGLQVQVPYYYYSNLYITRASPISAGAICYSMLFDYSEFITKFGLKNDNCSDEIHQKIQRGACIQDEIHAIHVHSIPAHSTHLNKMATSDFGPDTVISCERALFFIYIWIISWNATNRSLIQR